MDLYGSVVFWEVYTKVYRSLTERLFYTVLRPYRSIIVYKAHAVVLGILGSVICNSLQNVDVLNQCVLLVFIIYAMLNITSIHRVYPSMTKTYRNVHFLL